MAESAAAATLLHRRPAAAAGPDTPPRKLLWLDCDPGHDDAIAILMALYEPTIELLGISTARLTCIHERASREPVVVLTYPRLGMNVHGNASLDCTTVNAARCLQAFGAPQNILVFPGASKPLIGQPHPSIDIHGNDGLGGVEGLPDANDLGVKARIVPSYEGTLPAIEGMKKAATKALIHGKKLYLGVTGAATNAAIFILTHPELAKNAIQQIVIMGGGDGVGNVTASAEFNIYVDPEAAQVIFESGIPIFSIPLNVTHQAIFHVDAHRYLLDPSLDPSTQRERPLPAARTPLRHTLSTLLTFFAQTYKDVFGFEKGPPVHDALVVAYIAKPQCFRDSLCRVDVELAGKYTRGAFVVDKYDRIGGAMRNVEMATSVEVHSVLRDFFLAVYFADKESPLNADAPRLGIDIQFLRGHMFPVPASAIAEVRQG